MELNKLPEDHDAEKLGPQKRRTEFESEEAKLQYDARNLIAIEQAQYEKTGERANPIIFARREDNDIEALRAAITKEQKAVSPESVEVDPRLSTFKADFDQDEALKSKCTWELIQRRLLANEDHYLALALAMEGGGILFGVDKEGNPLIADRGDEPIMKGMNYKITRDRVLYKHTRLDRSGQIVLGEDKKPISTGYEMFPYIEPYEKSEEILQYEAHTEKSFVTSPNGDEFRSFWAESGKNLSWPRDVAFCPNFGFASVII